MAEKKTTVVSDASADGTPVQPDTEAAPAPGDPGPAVPPYAPDRVAMVSLRADGTPDQTPGFEVITDEPDPRFTDTDRSEG